MNNETTYRQEQNKEGRSAVRNTRSRDNGAKLVFDDPTLCAQFLRGYTNLELLKDVQPEDIEDVSERFLPMFQEGRDSDSVKKIRLKDTSLFLIAIIEHQSSVHYDTAFRVLRYMVMVLTDYAAGQERETPGITSRKEFRYPPILPIVFYDGPGNWTAVRNFRERVQLSEILGDYIPNFEYIVVPLAAFSNQELIEKKDELALFMLVDKLRNSSDFSQLRDIPREYLDEISKNSPDYMLKLLGRIFTVLLYRLNVPADEIEKFTSQIERREMAMLFENFEAYDVQETRRVSRAEGRTEGRIAETSENILAFLRETGPIPEEVKKRILEETDLETLRGWLRVAARAESAEEFCNQISEKKK